MPEKWKITGGADTGGVLVREGKGLGSAKLGRISFEAEVEQIEVSGERLHYKKVTGDGPEEGWISWVLKDKILAEKIKDKPAGAAESTPAAAEEAAPKVSVPSAESLAARPQWKVIPEDVYKTLPARWDPNFPKNVKQFKEVVTQEGEGDYWHIKFPFTPQMLKDMGPKWMTEAMHLCGSLAEDNEVTKFVEMKVMAEDVNKQDAENAKWGGAGIKILMKLQYKNGPTGDLTDGCFIKMPHEYKAGNERYKNSVGNGGAMDWSEVTFYNMFGGRFGHLPFKSPTMYFCDMCRRTTNFINIVERIPYAKTGTKNIGPGEYYPAPEKYKDWALPNNGIDLYYAHAKALAQFFGWHKMIREQTDQVEKIFGDEGALGFNAHVWGQVGGAGGYNSPERDAAIVGWMQADPGVYQAQGFPPQSAAGFKEMCFEFCTKTAKQAFPKECQEKAFQDKFNKEADDMAKYCGEMNFYMMAQPEYFALCHPNAQVDNAFYWKSDDGDIQCGLLDWGGVQHQNIPTCLGNGWMGAEPEVFEEHESKLVQLFIDEYEKVAGFRFDHEHLYMCLKLAQGAVFYGCCANIGMLLRIRKKDEWAKVKGRKDPIIDENFLMRCYFVQIHLWLKMWQTKISPYKFFSQWRDRIKLPKK